MAEKSRKYSFAAAFLFLAAFFAGAYNFILSVLYSAKIMDKSVFDVLEIMFKKDYRNSTIYTLGLLLVLLVLMIAMFSQSRGVFFVSVLLAVGLFAFRTYLWIDNTKDLKKWSWNSSKTFAFIYSVILVGLVLLFMFIMAIALLSASEAVEALGIIAFTLTLIGFLGSILTDVLSIYSKEFDIDEWETNLSRFQAGTMEGATNYLSMFLLVILLTRWAAARRNMIASPAEGAKKVNPNQQQVAVAPYFQPRQPQAPVQPIPVQGKSNYQATPQPVNPAPAQPVVPQPVNQAPVQPVPVPPVNQQPVQPAAQQPVNPAPAQPVIPQPAPAAPVAAEPAKPVAPAPEAPASEPVTDAGEEATLKPIDEKELAIDPALSSLMDKYAEEASETAKAASDAAVAVAETIEAAPGEVVYTAENAVEEAVETVTEAATDAVNEVVAEAVSDEGDQQS